MGGIFSKKGASGFSPWSTAEQVTEGINGTGLTAIVTEGSSGIGAETCRVLALCSVHVFMTVRNRKAGESVKETILEEIPGAKIDVRELDLKSLESVKKFGPDYCSSGLPLNILVGRSAPFKLSKDDIEMQFATNHLGHFLLIELLLETMKSTSRESKIKGRIINVSSSLHPNGNAKGFILIKLMMKQDTTYIMPMHNPSLLTCYTLMNLQGVSSKKGVKITANSLHPGMILTNIGRHDLLLSCILELPQYKQPMTYFHPRCNLQYDQGAATHAIWHLTRKLRAYPVNTLWTRTLGNRVLRQKMQIWQKNCGILA